MKQPGTNGFAAAKETYAETQLLLAQVLMKRGWFHMDRWEIPPARESFERALRLLREHADEAGFDGEVWQFHMRHAIAMIERLEGRPVVAADVYDLLVQDINHRRDGDDNLTSRQRWDLRERLVNALERRVDCDLYTALQEADFLVTTTEPRPEDSANDRARAAALAIEQAIDSIPVTSKGVSSPNPTRLPELFYKRCVALCLASDENVNDARNALDQAERMYQALGTDGLRKQLALSRAVALAAEAFVRARGESQNGTMDLTELPDRMRACRQARAELRRTLADHGTSIGSMKREQVEMLFLGCEVLLARRMLQGDLEEMETEELADLKADADFMDSILGRAIPTSSRGILQKYTERYRRIAQRNAQTIEQVLAQRSNGPVSPGPVNVAGRPIPTGLGAMRLGADAGEVVEMSIRLGPYFEFRLRRPARLLNEPGLASDRGESLSEPSEPTMERHEVIRPPISDSEMPLPTVASPVPPG